MVNGVKVVKVHSFYSRTTSVFACKQKVKVQSIDLITVLMREREKAIKKSGIGGKWELIDPKGNKISTDDFKGKWCMIYFGFTHCPGIDCLHSRLLLPIKMMTSVNSPYSEIFLFAKYLH